MEKRTSHLLAVVLLGLPVAALAHTGHAGHGFFDGLAHPFFGLDHLLAMLVVGIWSVLHARQVWLAPLCFVTLLAAGAVLGQHGLSVPPLEPLVAASVLVLGALLTLPFKPANSVALALVGGFAVFHGLAHGGELAAGGGVLSGMVVGSILLHATGMAFAHCVLKERPRLAQGLGQFVAVFGGGLLLAAVS